jgi:hypothetical protein
LREVPNDVSLGFWGQSGFAHEDDEDVAALEVVRVAVVGKILGVTRNPFVLPRLPYGVEDPGIALKPQVTVLLGVVNGVYERTACDDDGSHFRTPVP